jgi:elongation factor G
VKQPVHVIGITVYPETAEDLATLLAAMPHLADGDALAYRTVAGTGEVVLKGASEIHLDTAIDRLIREFGVPLTLGKKWIAYCETITKTVEQDHIHKKMTGSAGEFARVKVRFEPLPRGSGFQFVNAVAADRLPGEFAAAVGETLRDLARRTGAYSGLYPTIDFKATLIDSAFHATDSTVSAFRIAAGHCFREGMSRAGPQLLEPIMQVEVTTPAEFIGYVVADLNDRRASISGMDSRQDHWIVRATAPLREILGYASRLRSRTLGRGLCTMQFDHYAPCRSDDGPDPVHPGAAIGLR